MDKIDYSDFLEKHKELLKKDKNLNNLVNEYILENKIIGLDENNGDWILVEYETIEHINILSEVADEKKNS